MKRLFPIYAIIVMLAATVVCSCNGDDEDLSNLLPDPSADAVMVNTFALGADDDVLANLDSVFFSIDLDRAVIFNADSLPKGTKVNRLVTSMTFSGVKKAEITMPGFTGADTIVDYLKNPTDSIDFSRGSVKLHLESASGTVTRDYTIYVNVHKVDPDRMQWSELAWTLPTDLSNVVDQHTVELGDLTLCFTTDGTDFCRASATNVEGSWAKTHVDMPEGARLSTLTAGEDDLYLIDSDDNLCVSEDGGLTWTALSQKMSYIYGVVAGVVVGVRDNGSSFEYTTYPETNAAPVLDGMPVSATSPAIIYTTEWSENPMMIVAGGLDADGNPVSGLWAYDGGQWAKISAKLLPLESPVIVPYYAFRTAANWKVTRRSVLLCFGGRLADGSANRNVFISYDMGVNWATAPEAMALSATYNPGAYAQAIIRNRTMGSRAVKPITEWDCPFIYMFGGDAAVPSPSRKIWRGVINRLEFKPLQ